MTEQADRIPLFTKIIYGTGDWSMAAFNTLRQIFYAIFLTDVVGLDPRLASFAALIGVLWDAVNDPLVGVLSDKVRTRWGRRRPFLLFFAIPYGLAFLILWWAPPWKSQILLMIHVMLAYALSDTFQTLVIVPFHALTPEMTSDYDERTSLASYRMFFNFLASLAGWGGCSDDRGRDPGEWRNSAAGLFPGIGDLWGYVGDSLFAHLLRRSGEGQAWDLPEEVSFRATLRQAWQNVPFRYATALYMLNWVTFDLVAAVLPFFLVYWIAQGNLVLKMPGLGMPIESTVLGIMAVLAVPALPFWSWAARRFGKRHAYMAAVILWTLILMSLIFVPPMHLGLAMIVAVLMSFSYSAAHMLPDAIFPDVIDWDELRTGERHEGVYYGTKNFVRKLTTAFAIFLTLQVLGWLGYQKPPDSAVFFSQPAAVLTGIRVLIGPVASLLLLALLAVTWFYPLNRSRYARVQRLLARRKLRNLGGAAGEIMSEGGGEPAPHLVGSPVP